MDDLFLPVLSHFEKSFKKFPDCTRKGTLMVPFHTIRPSET